MSSTNFHRLEITWRDLQDLSHGLPRVFLRGFPCFDFLDSIPPIPLSTSRLLLPSPTSERSYLCQPCRLPTCPTLSSTPQSMQTTKRLLGASRLPLTTKRGNKDYYKGMYSLQRVSLSLPAVGKCSFSSVSLSPTAFILSTLSPTTALTIVARLNAYTSS